MALLSSGCPKCILGFQIPPQEDDYGFDLEEKNKAVVVKSVQRGSLAEVRPTGRDSGGAVPPPGGVFVSQGGTSLAGSEVQGSWE